MRTRWLAIAVLVIMPNVAFADVKTDLQDRYAAMKIAMAARDGAAIQALLTSDFKSIDINGQSEDATQMIAEVMGMKPDPNKTSQTTVLSVEVSGDTADVEQAYDMSTQKTGADGQTHAVRLTTESHDVWKMAGQTWLLASTRTEVMDYAIDGKTVVHKTAAP